MKKAKKVKKIEYHNIVAAICGGRDKEIARLNKLVNTLKLVVATQRLAIKENERTIKDEQSAVKALHCNMQFMDYRWRKVVNKVNTTGKGCCCSGFRCFKGLLEQEEKRLEKFR